MPIPGLSLLGFMNEELALHYLTNTCVCPDTSPQALLRHWQDAQTRIGPPMDRAGHPQMRDMHPERQRRLRQLTRDPSHQVRLRSMSGGLLFKEVEIAPLIAFQFHVLPEYAARLCEKIKRRTPGIDDMLDVCLPRRIDQTRPQETPSHNGVLIRSRDLGIRILGGGTGEQQGEEMFNAGVAYGVASPLVIVARLNDRCYLMNGYHRVYGLYTLGATHIPCLFWEGAIDYAGIGAVGGNATFDRTVLESNNPPTCGHFTDLLAYPLQIRALSRVIHVTWTEYAVAEE